MALRVTARRAQRLGSTTPSQTPGTANRAGRAGGVGISSASRCSAKCAVRATVPPVIAAWNCARVFSRCMLRRSRPEPDGQTGARGRPTAATSDGQALAALGAARVDHGPPAPGLHAHEKAMGARAARLGGLIGAFHAVVSLKKRVRFRMAIGPDGLRWGFTSMVLDALPGRQWQRAGGRAFFCRAWLLHIAVVHGPARQPPWQALPSCHHLSLSISSITLMQGRKTGDYCRLAGG